MQTSILERKSKPADLFETRVGIIALLFSKTISIIIINLLVRLQFSLLYYHIIYIKNTKENIKC